MLNEKDNFSSSHIEYVLGYTQVRNKSSQQVRKCSQMHADANISYITNIKVHASELLCTQMTAENLFRFATCTQSVFADDRRWHADFPVPHYVTCWIAQASQNEIRSTPQVPHLAPGQGSKRPDPILIHNLWRKMIAVAGRHR